MSKFLTDEQARKIREFWSSESGSLWKRHIFELLADREERVRLMREVDRFMSHQAGCRSTWIALNSIRAACECGLGTLLDEVREAVT